MTEAGGRISRSTRTLTVDDDGLDEFFEPVDVVVERRVAGVEGRHGRFEFAAEEGPFEHYRRTLVVSPDTGGGHVVEETTEFRLATPVWRPLLTPALRLALRRRGRKANKAGPWWAPPDVFGRRAATVLSVLCALSIFSSYQGTLLSMTITFAAEEFGADDRSQGFTLAAVRIGVLLALVTSVLADRRGRRTLLTGSLLIAALLTATTALAPSLLWFGASQTLARGLTTGAALLIGITAAEEVPAGSRSWAVSVVTLCGGLGSGMVAWILPIAGMGPTAWRVLFLVPLVGVPAMVALRRRLPESRRFEANVGSQSTTNPSGSSPGWLAGMSAKRFWMVAAASFLALLFLSPASQFRNEYLRDELGFSAAKLTAFTLLTNTPAGIGVYFGGRLADVWGRRIVGVGALFVLVSSIVWTYFTGGWSLWLVSVIGATVGAAFVPAMGVYGPEMFPTARRGTANGLISVIGVMGSGLGLLTAGILSERFGRIGPAFAVLAIGPLLLCVLILVAFPETARQKLEDLNPGDRAGSA